MSRFKKLRRKAKNQGLKIKSEEGELALRHSGSNTFHSKFKTLREIEAALKELEEAEE